MATDHGDIWETLETVLSLRDSLIRTHDKRVAGSITLDENSNGTLQLKNELEGCFIALSAL